MSEYDGLKIFAEREIETIRLYESPEPMWLAVKALGEMVMQLKAINENLAVISDFIKTKVQ